MYYGIPTIAAEDLRAAAEPIIGLEAEEVYFSCDECGELMFLEQAGADEATIVASTNAYDIPVAGVETLQLVAKTGVKAPSGPITITLNVTTDAGADTAVVVVDEPQYCNDDAGVFPIGAGWDFVLQTYPNARITAIGTVASVTGGKAGNKFVVITLPELASYVRLGCIRQKDPTIPVPNTLNIACGRESAAFTKQGVTEVPELTLTQINLGYGCTLGRLAGHNVTIMIQVKSNSRILKERMVFCNYKPTPSFGIGDGEDESEMEATGPFTTFAIFDAETSAA